MNIPVKGKDLKSWGLPAGPAYSVAMKLFSENRVNYLDALKVVKGVVAHPEDWLNTPYAPIAQALVDARPKSPQMRHNGVLTNIYGEHMIEGGALAQIHAAAKLPVAVQAAVMPDGHQGYGLPIGGVLATDNAVIPFAVGYDIGCRMHMSVLPITEHEAHGKDGMLSKALELNTVFGRGIPQDDHALIGPDEVAVLDDPLFRDIPAIKKLNLHHVAAEQIGTSGSGNHFVEFGFAEVPGVEGTHLAILSHSGSRRVGYEIADVYSKLAMDSCKLPGEMKRLAWLSLDDDAGREYWEAMGLAGRFAQACHRMIHRRLCKALKVHAVATFENHHNFAWKETLNGKPVIVHRKGATPANLGEIGLIPGSMTTKTYVVRGKGNPGSIFSSSHGAGRLMSRSVAKQTFTMSQMRKNIEDAGVILSGGSLDECSMAYKDIEEVIREQADLVEPVGWFRPWIVKMSHEEEGKW